MLLVDDSPFNLELLEDLILKEFDNVSIFKALDGQQAVDMVREQDLTEKPFKIIFMDINMPVMDGLESSKTITSLA